MPYLGKVKRKLAYFPDKEDKMRVIAIGDYLSQSVLKPLHHYLFQVIKKIPQDCTFDQGAFKDRIQGWSEFYSIDLTAATDRFPISFEKMVLNGHFPGEYTNAWQEVMVGTPFRYIDPSNKVHEVSYNVGNPMGFYSS